ncbi:MAG: hypothetical protein IPJ94_28025 [Chloroflexi bacterium]|nr:hypothetical protein [Chloroflexota bacterium]
MRPELTLDAFIQRLKSKKLTDKRTGQNIQYQVNDAQAPFAIFFMQSASFLAGQRHLRQAKGKSNAETVFKMERIPTDTHIRNLLDPVSPSELSGEFRFLLAQLADSGHLSQWYRAGQAAVVQSGRRILLFLQENILCKVPETRA